MALLKDARQKGRVFQDTEPPESSPILRKSIKILGPIGRVQFTKATQRHYAVKFEDRSQEETERQERCARGDSWRSGQEDLKAQRKGQSYLLLTLPTNGVSKRHP